MPATKKRYEVPKNLLATLLQRTGWIKGRADAEKLTKAVRSYQRFHGLKADGWAGHVTERHLMMPRFCPHGDKLEMRGTKNRWDPSIATSLKWGVTGKPSQFSLDEWKGYVQEAFDAWSRVCNVRATYTNNSKTVNFLIGVARIDGPGGTLGWSYLPQGRAYRGKIEQRYDATERWVYSEDPANHEIDILRVLKHEIGHGIGLPHLSNGNLLQPMYDRRIRSPQPGDVVEVVERYGEPADVEPSPPPGPERRLTIVGQFEVTEG